MSLDILRNELLTDPLGIGYAAMSDAQATASLNAMTRHLPRSVLQGGEVYEVTDIAERAALTAVDKTDYNQIVSLSGGIICGPGSKARQRLAAMFGPASVTRAALLNLTDGANGQTRGVEIGHGTVHQGDVAAARA